MSGPVPIEMSQASPTELAIRWDDGHQSTYAVAAIRRACRCASCIDEWTGRPILDPGDVPDDVRPVRVDPVGRYAIHIEWTDGHRSGIYAFKMLREMCPCGECRSHRGAA